MRLTDISLIAVGSTNPVKVAAVRDVVRRVHPTIAVVGYSVPSGVPDQPWGDDETIRGATARARRALELAGAELAVGLEGGCVLQADGTVHTCAWAVAVDAEGHVATGGSLAMPLPEMVGARLRAGEELGPAMDAVSGIVGVKHGAGAVGILTGGLVNRQRAYEVLVAYALSRWLAPEYWVAPSDVR